MITPSTILYTPINIRYILIKIRYKPIKTRYIPIIIQYRPYTDYYPLYTNTIITIQYIPNFDGLEFGIYRLLLFSIIYYSVYNGVMLVAWV